MTGASSSLISGGTALLSTGGGGAVSSVFGRTGAVTAQTGDYTIAQISGAGTAAAENLTAIITDNGSGGLTIGIGQVTAAMLATGVGVPGGSPQQLQYNNTAFGGLPGSTINGTNFDEQFIRTVNPALLPPTALVLTDNGSDDDNYNPGDVVEYRFYSYINVSYDAQTQVKVVSSTYATATFTVGASSTSIHAAFTPSVSTVDGYYAIRNVNSDGFNDGVDLGTATDGMGNYGWIDDANGFINVYTSSDQFRWTGPNPDFTITTESVTTYVNYLNSGNFYGVYTTGIIRAGGLDLASGLTIPAGGTNNTSFNANAIVYASSDGTQLISETDIVVAPGIGIEAPAFYISSSGFAQGLSVDSNGNTKLDSGAVTTQLGSYQVGIGGGPVFGGGSIPYGLTLYASDGIIGVPPSTGGANGTNLTFVAGNASSGTDLNGGNVIISPGNSTGVGHADVVIYGMPGGSSGSSFNAALEFLRMQGSTKTILTGTGIKLQTGASTTSNATFNLSSGADPSSPVSGDFWFKQSNFGVFFSPNGTTKQIPLMNSANLTAQSAAVSSVATASTPVGSALTYAVQGYLTVTAATLDVIALQVTYTDETSTSRTQTVATMPSALTGAYSGVAIIRVKANTTATAKTVLTTSGGSITYDVGVTFTQLN
jgi:hypothetical protein